MNINDRYKSSGIASPYNLKQSLDRFFDDIANTSPKSILKNSHLNLFEAPATSGTPLEWDLTGTGYFQYINSNTASGVIGAGSAFSQNISDKLLPNAPYTVLVYASMPVTGIEFSITADNDSQVFNLEQGSTEINSATITANVTSANKYAIQFSTNVAEVSGGVYFNISNPTGSDADITIKYATIYRGLIEFGETTDISDVYYAELAGVAVSAHNLIDQYKPMVTKWLLTDDNEIELPLPFGGTYDFIVDWGDGNTNAVTAYDSGNSHTYATSGVKTVTILGQMSQWRFPLFHFSAEKLTHVVKGGYTGLTSLYQGFFNCQNLIYVDNDPVWTKNVTNMGDMFRSCVLFNSELSNLNTSNVTDMSGMFFSATSFNKSLDEWDTSRVTTMYQMFRDATSFNQPLNSWDVSNVTDMSYMFYGATNFDSNISSWDVSNVTTLEGTFSLSNFNQQLNNWDISSVTTIDQLFSENNVFNQPLYSWNTSNVTIMSDVFNRSFLFDQDISSWDTSNVTDMNHMFDNATSFNQDISSWTVSGVTNMTSMFFEAVLFNQPLNTWDVSNVTSMLQMFAYASDFNQPLDNWNTSSVTDMQAMFYNCSSFNQDISSWSVSGVTTMNNILNFTSWSSTNYDLMLNSWSTQPVQTGVNFNCYPTPYTSEGVSGRDILINTYSWVIADGGLVSEYLPMITEWSLTTDNTITLPLAAAGTYDFIVDWGDGNTNPVTAYNSGNSHTYATSGIKTVSVTGLMTHWSFNNTGDKLKITSVLSGGYTGLNNLYAGFHGCSNLTFIENNPIWTKSVVSMQRMLYNATSFNSPISDWDVSNVTNMNSMFYQATIFDQDISAWDVSKVTDMSFMFYNITSFNQDISSWTVSGVNNMSGMFYYTTLFNQPLSGWDVSNVVSFSSMFRNATSFNQPLNSWNVSSVGNMYQMFYNATSFNQALDTWNTVNVFNMYQMFYNATSFNQPLDTWDTSNVSNMTGMFYNATSFNQNISMWNYENIYSLTNSFDNTAISQTYYQLMLYQWASNYATLNPNIIVGATGLQYNSTYAGYRNYLISTLGWSFVGDTLV